MCKARPIAHELHAEEDPRSIRITSSRAEEASSCSSGELLSIRLENAKPCGLTW